MECEQGWGKGGVLTHVSLELSQIFTFEFANHARPHSIVPDRLIPNSRKVNRAIVGFKHLFNMLDRSSSTREGGHAKTTLVGDRDLGSQVPVPVHRSGMRQQLFFSSERDQLINTTVTSPRLIRLIKFTLKERLIIMINPTRGGDAS
jgi:hypothetical protein